MLTFGIIHLNLDKLLNIGPMTISVGLLLVVLYNVINGIRNPIFETSNLVVYYECIKY